MDRVRLIHWKADEARPLIRRLRSYGYRVTYQPAFGPSELRRLRSDPPHAIVIDLARLPSRGRDVALAVRRAKETRRVPILFVGGAPEKSRRVRRTLPDAVYTDRDHLLGRLRWALAHPPKHVHVPSSAMEGYAGVGLHRKLGIRPGSVVALSGAPCGFEARLQPLPEGTRLVRNRSAARDLTLWFPKSDAWMSRSIGGMVQFAHKGRLWVLWPKKASRIRTDLSQAVVRKIGLAAGLVDFKIAAVDETWSGLRFTLRPKRL